MGAFFDVMLRRRGEDLEAALANERMRRKDLAALGDGIGDFLGNMAKGLAQSR